MEGWHSGGGGSDDTDSFKMAWSIPSSSSSTDKLRPLFISIVKAATDEKGLLQLKLLK